MGSIKHRDCYINGNIDIFLGLVDWENRLQQNRGSGKRRNKKDQRTIRHHILMEYILEAQPQNSYQDVLEL